MPGHCEILLIANQNRIWQAILTWLHSLFVDGCVFNEFVPKEKISLE